MTNLAISLEPAAIDSAIEHAKNDPVGTYGPWIAGLLGFTLMTGVITAQATRYFSLFGVESRGLFTGVVLCIALVLTQWVLMIHASWSWFVVRFGDSRAFAEVFWPVWSLPIVSQATVFTAQLFFAWRCYSLYRRDKHIFAGLLFGMSASLVLFTVGGVAGVTDPFNYKIGRQLTTPALCVNLVTDLAIAGLILWKLGIGGGKGYSPNTNEVLRRLRNLTVEAAVPPAICSVLTMSLYLSTGEKNLAFITSAIITPSLYVFSMMLTLNSRRSIRQKFNSPNHFLNVELSNVLGSDSKARQTESHRTRIVFATFSPVSAPNTSMGIVNQRVEGSEGPKLYGRRSRNDDELTTPGASHKEPQVDLDRLESEVRSGLPCSATATPEPPSLTTSSEDASKRPI